MPAEKIRLLGDLFGRRDLRITSLWCMGMNQHTRGTAINDLVHGVHLLSGHFGKPGDAPTSLTGQPSACGTVREVGTLAHALPGGLVVANEKHRQEAEEIWNLPAGRINPKPGLPHRRDVAPLLHARGQGRRHRHHLGAGDQPGPVAPQHQRDLLPVAQDPRKVPDRLRRVPDRDRAPRRPDLALGHVGREERHGRQLGAPHPAVVQDGRAPRARPATTAGSSSPSPAGSSSSATPA